MDENMNTQGMPSLAYYNTSEPELAQKVNNTRILPGHPNPVPAFSDI
jgi:hypothetical protein